MSHALFVQLEFVLTIGACAFSLLKGGVAERWGATLIVGDYVLAEIAVLLSYPHFPTSINFALDFALAVALLIVAIRFSSLWLGGAMLLQSIALCSYGFAASGDGLHNRSYVILNNGLSLLMLACIVSGAVGSWRKRIKMRRVEGALAVANTVVA